MHVLNILEMPIRRSADPFNVQIVWEAIKHVNTKKQIADISRLVKFLQRVLDCTEIQAEMYINQVLGDGLILLVSMLKNMVVYVVTLLL